MKILLASASPYSSKVRMAAVFTGLDFEAVAVETGVPPEILLANNPLGKIPVLITDGGEPIYDSRSIMHFLNRESGGRLYPAGNPERTRAEVLEALGDGITDCLITHVYERRFHAPEKVEQPWLDRQWEKVRRGLDHLQENPPRLDEGLQGGHFSLAAMSGYLALRFAGKFEENWPWIGAFAADFQKAFPAYEELKPRA